MRNYFFSAATAVALVASSTVSLGAQARTITFEGLADQEEVGSFYSGLNFSNSALALIRGNLPGGSGNFGGEPSPGTALVFTGFPGDAAFLNVSGGFSSGFSLYYSAPGVPGMVRLFDGLNGTGALLGTLMLPVTPFGSVAGCPQNPGASFCPFSFAELSFGGNARSVDFGATLNDFVFDDLTLVNAAATVVPEPGTAMMFVFGLLGVCGVLARQRLTRAPNHQAEGLTKF
ncbi:MAG: PEP-CTERM sorting domain-containing protein [Phycisphaerae bacterium]|nr:PEP-CTERM sorting domain-containing protein [Gemmatimonadaceae bacterium]